MAFTEYPLPFEISTGKVYHTVRVDSRNAGRSSQTVNSVSGGHLAEHIDYNKTMRFGQALFVNGHCVFTGYLSNNDCRKLQKQFLKDRLFLRTQPVRLPYR